MVSFSSLMVIYKNKPQATHFLNVDLDIYSRSDLELLVTAMGKTVYALYVGRDKRAFCAHLELSAVTKDADATIRRFCALIQSLPKSERTLWDTARTRDFNIGMQSAAEPHCYEMALEAETVKAASTLGARIVFTVYAPEKPEKTPGSKKVARSKPVA